MKRLFASVFCALLLQGSALATTLQTQIGDISIPTAKEINEQIDSLASDASLSDDDKKTLGTLYKTGLDTLDQISDLTAQQKDLDKYLKDANRKLLRLATDYGRDIRTGKGVLNPLEIYENAKELGSKL